MLPFPYLMQFALLAHIPARSGQHPILMHIQHVVLLTARCGAVLVPYAMLFRTLLCTTAAVTFLLLLKVPVLPETDSSDIAESCTSN